MVDPGREAPARLVVGEQLAREIRRLRREAGLSQPELAARIGYTPQYVSLAERPRKGVPSAGLVAALDAALQAHGALIALRERAAQERCSRRASPAGHESDPAMTTSPVSAALLDAHIAAGGSGQSTMPPVDLHSAAAAREKEDQDEWLRIRQASGVRGRELTELAAWLYPPAERAPGGHVMAGPNWLMEGPVELDSVELHWEAEALPFSLPRHIPVDHLLPMSDRGFRYTDYSRAVRDLVRPRLLENRPSYRLTGINVDDGLRLKFSRTTFFEVFNLKQMIAHEFKRAWFLSGKSMPRLEDLPLRSAIGDPFDPAKLLMSPGINTLTIRRGNHQEGAGFVLHERSGGKVADGGGLCHVIPAGEFQPSSAAFVNIQNDFSLWRNIMREFSEEFLGNSEHDGCNPRPIDYRGDEPFARFEDARKRGTLRVWHYGLVVEPLELGVQQLTVAVIDAPTYDKLFSRMVTVNDEGTIVDRRGVKHIPFLADTIDRLEPRLSASALTLLRMAWNDRATLLGA